MLYHPFVPQYSYRLFKQNLHAYHFVFALVLVQLKLQAQASKIIKEINSLGHGTPVFSRNSHQDRVNLPQNHLNKKNTQNEYFLETLSELLQPKY